MREVLGGPTTNNDANSYNKIIRNIMKEIMIDKGKQTCTDYIYALDGNGPLSINCPDNVFRGG